MTSVRYISRLLCLVVTTLVVSGQTPRSPCPSIFTYENNGQRWYGKIQLHASSQENDVTVNVKMSLGARLPTKYNGKVELMKERQMVLNDISRGLPITYKVNFPILFPLPKLTRILYNGNVICSGPPETFSNKVTTVTEIAMDHTLHVGGGGSSGQRPSSNNIYESNYSPLNEPYQQQQPAYNYGTVADDSSVDKFVEWTLSKPKEPEPVRNPIRPSSFSGSVTSPPPKIPQPRPQPQSDDLQDCGIAIANPLFIGGDETKQGDWPWLVAIYVKQPSSLDFICGGTLISHRHVITAAHCVNTKAHVPEKVDNFILKFGAFNLQDWTDTNVKQLGLIKAVSHPNYTGGKSYLDDISILVVAKWIDFTNYITPACLWNMNTDLSEIVGENGTVVGWGRDENGLIVTPEPRAGKVPIVSTVTCRASLPQFSRLTSDKTLCAGGKTGIGPCNGDSGGGMYLNVRSKWYLRAIVSISLPGTTSPCNLEQYVVYTDTAQYLPWIRQIMSENS